MDVTKPYDFIGFGDMDVTKPYKFIWFGAVQGGQTLRLRRKFESLCGCQIASLEFYVYFELCLACL